MQKEREIQFEDCHIGDVFKLDRRSPWVVEWIMESNGYIPREEITAEIVHMINNGDIKEVGINVYIGKASYDHYDTSYLREGSRYKEDNLEMNLKMKNHIKAGRKNNYY